MLARWCRRHRHPRLAPAASACGGVEIGTKVTAIKLAGGAGVRSHVAIAVVAAIEAEAVVVKVIRTRSVLRILVAIVVEQAIAAAGAVVAGRGCPSDVVEAGLARQLAAGAAPGG